MPTNIVPDDKGQALVNVTKKIDEKTGYHAAQRQFTKRLNWFELGEFSAKEIEQLDRSPWVELILIQPIPERAAPEGDQPQVEIKRKAAKKGKS